MTRKAKVVLNVHGGHLGPEAKQGQVEAALRGAGIDYHLERTTEPGHGIEIARQASLEGWPIVIAAGGDGTINEVVNGLAQAAGDEQAGTLGIVPMGTANDLADGLKLPREVTAACQRIVIGNTRVIDLGQVNGRYFANNSAIGLETLVTIAHDQMRLVKGNLRYILAAFKGILMAKSWSMRLTWNNGQYEGPVTLVSIGNNCRTGGEFFMTPHAILDDGLMDFMFGAKMSRWQMMRLLPKTFSGQHIHDPLVVYRQSTMLSITTSPPTPIQTDGEIIEKEATEINYRIVPRKLRVIV